MGDDEQDGGRTYLLILQVQRTEKVADPILDMHRLKAWYESQQSSWDNTGMFTMKRIVIMPIED